MFSGGTTKFYIDGALDSEKDFGASSFNTTSDGIKIGDREYTGDEMDDLKGEMDEVRLYDRALTEEEIQELYDGGGGNSPTITSVEPDPVPGSDEAQPLTVRGSGFVEGAFVILDDLSDDRGPFENPDATSFVSSTELTRQATFGESAATWSARVENPDGTRSDAVQFEVEAPDLPIAQSFAYPVSSSDYVTEANDEDGWYNAQDFGVANSDFDGQLHLGEDWNAESGDDTDCGSPVYATAAGTIVYAGNAGSSLGNVVVVRHELPDGSKVESLYMHLESIARTSGNVEKREEIGAIGDADGYYPSCHLHFAIRLPSSDEDPDWGEPGPGYASSTDGWTDPSDFVDARLADGETPYTVSISARRITALTIPSYTGNFPPQNNGEAEAVLDALPNIQFSQDKVVVRARVELKEGRIQPVTDVEVQATYKGAPLDIVLNDKVDSNRDGRIDRIPLDANGREDLPFADVLAVSPSSYSSGTQGALAATASTSAHSATANETLSLHYAQHGTQERPFSLTRDGYIFENPTVRSWREYFRLLPELSLGEAMTAWGGYLQLDMGRCYGMSGTSGLYFANPSKKLLTATRTTLR
jgi:murein DD-endopeptidase MepM/ murein hydrolase activator NlpD